MLVTTVVLTIPIIFFIDTGSEFNYHRHNRLHWKWIWLFEEDIRECVILYLLPCFVLSLKLR